MTVKFFWILCFLTCFSISSFAVLNEKPDNSLIKFTINQLHVTLDKNTGSIVKICTRDGITFLDRTPLRASVIDLAYPIKKFEPLRLASRFSQNVQIENRGNDVVVIWENLGASRSFPLDGSIRVTVQFKTAPDDNSMILTCKIENNSDQSIPQVLFPDLAGLIPFAGIKQTRFRSAAFVIAPFEMLRPDPEMVPFYATGPYHVGNGWVEYKSGKYKSFSQKLIDWLDLGDVKNGFSVFARRWPPEEPDASVMLHLSEIDNKLRLLFAHTTDIKPGEKWQSGEYWLTPHEHGWAEGIQPYRKWVEQNLRRSFEQPEHIKNGMGFRSIWLTKGLVADPKQDVLYSYKDLPFLAKESIENGLNEMVIWFWCDYFQLPFSSLDYLGSKQDLIDALVKCKEIGVNVSLFISVLYLKNPTAARYGLTPTKEMSWSYHPDLIPEFNPPYASWNEAVMAEQDNAQWQADVYASFKELIDLGLTSFVWDVFMAAPTQPNLYDLAEMIRITCKKRDLQSVFAGEGGCNIGYDYKYLDYTWNWNWNWPHYKDFRAFTSVFPAPRLNVNIDESAQIVKYCFADNAYMNVMPSQPDGINASDLITNHPPLHQALQECARLRQQFLPYFTDGRLIGECILTEDCPGIHVSAYVLPKKILAILVNDENPKTALMTCQPGYWLSSQDAKFTVNIYNSQGKLVETQNFTDKIWQYQTPELQPLEIMLYEFLLTE